MKRAPRVIAQRSLVVTLILTLMLIGVGRGFALAAPSQMTAIIDADGTAITICHSGGDDGSHEPGAPQHECCDTCILMAPVTLPSIPQIIFPYVLAYYIEHADAMPWVPAVARVRTPRQSQGPPQA